MELGLIAIGAGLAVGLAAIATGYAQARIGAAAMGAITEKPEMTGRAILLVAIPETLVILGFAVAAMSKSRSGMSRPSRRGSPRARAKISMTASSSGTSVKRAKKVRKR